MPKLTSKLPSYRRHSNGKQAIVVLSGKTYYLGLHGSRASRREYDRVVSEWLQRGRTPEPCAINQESASLADIMTAYLKYCREYYVKDGKVTDEFSNVKNALRIVKALYVHIPAVEFGPIALRAVREKMLEKGWARTTINRRIQHIVRMFKWAASREMISANTHQALKTVEGLRKGRTTAREPKPVLPVDDDTIEATLEHLSPIVADMVRFQRLTGARPGEVCHIRPCDIDRTAEIWEYRPSSHKNEHHERDRIVFIGPTAQSLLRQYLLRPAVAFCFSPREANETRQEQRHRRRKTPISRGNRPGTNRTRRPNRTAGEMYTNDSYRRAVHRACKKAGVHAWNPNRLRHSSATAIRKEYGLEAAQVILGHAQADVSQLYAEKDKQLAVEVARKLG